jgi:hypothetical protein
LAIRFRTRALVCLTVWAVGATASAQTATTGTVELDLTGGYSTESIGAAGSQLRLFGDVGARTSIQYFAEAAWGDRWAGDEPVIGEPLIGVDRLGTDVFGAAYPYSGEVELTDVFAERTFRPRGLLFGVRAGQYRTPFGIYTRSDHAYSGFIRPPLIRYDGYFALSNNYYERGAAFTAGVPQLFVETSVGTPHDIGSSQRRDGVDESVRVQGYFGSLIAGVSHVRSEPYLPKFFAFGRQVFTGVDFRWTHGSGVQARGELVKGHSFDGVSTTGWYVDAFVHHVGMGPFTAVARGEAMDYTASAPFARSQHRFTLGTKVRLPAYFTAQMNYMHQKGDLPRIGENALDFTLTYSVRYP